MKLQCIEASEKGSNAHGSLPLVQTRTILTLLNYICAERFLLRRCFGRTRNFRRCGRQGDWRFFCDDHSLQPIGWIIFLVFTVLAGTATIYSTWLQTKLSAPKSTVHEVSEPASKDMSAKSNADSPRVKQSSVASHANIDISLALIPTVLRVKDPAGGYMRGGQNDLVGVVRIRQRNGKSARHVRSLQVKGEVAADFNSYVGLFSRGDGSESEDDVEADYKRRRPFFRLSWISFPLAPIRLDENDEEFGKFFVTQTLGAIEFAGDPRDYLGFWSTGQEPKYPLTCPTWSLLMHFSKAAPDATGIYPGLRDEVKAGRVKIQVEVDADTITIPPEQIRFPWAVSLGSTTVEKMSVQDLFYGIDHGLRSTIPTPNDPLVKSK